MVVFLCGHVVVFGQFGAVATVFDVFRICLRVCFCAFAHFPVAFGAGCSRFVDGAESDCRGGCAYCLRMDLCGGAGGREMELCVFSRLFFHLCLACGLSWDFEREGCCQCLGMVGSGAGVYGCGGRVVPDCEEVSPVVDGNFVCSSHETVGWSCIGVFLKFALVARMAGFSLTPLDKRFADFESGRFFLKKIEVWS